MTHPDGGSGTGPSGPAGPGPRDLPGFDRTVGVLADAFGRAYGRLSVANLAGDTVAQADAAGSLVDLRTAAHIRGGADPSALDRNGWPSGQLTAFTRSSAMRGNPDTNPHPQPSDPAAPPPPRLKPSPGPVDTNDPQPAGPPPPVA